jgi:SpoVK/Ycf46/Vps4 family AAA+-type ATPase
MLDGNDAVEALRDALRAAPDNVPLRKHLAEMLIRAGRPDEAAEEFRKALDLAPGDDSLKIGLGNAFYRAGKHNHALVIIEEFLQRRDTPAAIYLLHARVLLRQGDAERAVRQYHQAIDLDPSLEDKELSERLGVGADEHDEIEDGRIRVAFGEGPEAPEIEMEKPSVTFNDVGGMEAVKDEIRMKIIHPLTHADLYRSYGKPIGGGILLYGPPGCGKTYLARATAGEIQAGFLVVGISDVLDMWLGNSERNLHGIFQAARARKPCVLFFDEVDALGASRTDLRQSAGRQVVNQFLSELDGVKDTNEGVLILAATNAPWHLDPAFRRPGRFDRIVFVPPPDAPARSAILRILCRGKPVGDIEFDRIGEKLADFSGADLKAVIDLAVEDKLREAIRKGIPEPLATADLLAAGRKIKPSTREWFSTARNYAVYANQGGIYDDILKYLKL